MKLELDIVWHKIMTLTIVILLSINDGVSQSAVEQREQFFLEALEHPENIKEQINGYAQYRNDKDKQEFYRIYQLTEKIVNPESTQNLHPNTFISDPYTMFFLQGYLPIIRFSHSKRSSEDRIRSMDQVIGRIMRIMPDPEYYSKAFHYVSQESKNHAIENLKVNFEEVYVYLVKCILYINSNPKTGLDNPINNLEKAAALVKIIKPVKGFFKRYIPNFQYHYYAIIYSHSNPYITLVDLGDGVKLEEGFYQDYFDNYANPFSPGKLEEDRSYDRYWKSIESQLPHNTDKVFLEAKGVYTKVVIESIIDSQGSFLSNSIDIIRNWGYDSNRFGSSIRESSYSKKNFDLFGFPDYGRLSIDSLAPKNKGFTELMFSRLDKSKSEEDWNRDMENWTQNQQELFKRTKERKKQDSTLKASQETRLYNWAVKESVSYQSIPLSLTNEPDSILSPLLMSKHEILVLNKMLRESGYSGSYFMDTLATENNLKEIQSPSILHISTHAENKASSGAKSVIDLSQPDGAKLFLSGAYYHLNKDSILMESKRRKEKAEVDYSTELSQYFSDHVYTEELQKLMLNSKSKELKKALEEYLESISEILKVQASTFQKPIQSFYDLNSNFNSMDGILDSKEIRGLNLPSTQIVTLAVCGPANSYTPEYHIAEYFLQAGAKNVVGSFWQVNDEATVILMLKFYKYWLQGDSVREALKKAQRVVRKTPGFEHPYFWGGWVVYGQNYIRH